MADPTQQPSPRDRFLRLLRHDILKLDAAELDFGIYRILAYRRTQVLDYLEHKLPERIDTWGSALAAATEHALAQDEAANCYYHLHTFFRRYWDEGDFIPRARRGGSTAYAVPYNGEDTHFHWATKGSHYVKSGELFARYAYRDGTQELRFVLDQADITKDNAKGAAKFFFPERFEPTEAGHALHWQWRAATDAEAKRYKGKAPQPDDDGTEPELAETEGGSLQERVLNAWLQGADFKGARIPKGLNPELLARNARRYVRKNTQDFFVHPQLGCFLRGELEVYLKHEFVQVWDAADSELPRIRAKFKLVRDIALDLITFLDQIEQFQASLFEKRKFVLQADYLVQCSWLRREGGAAGQRLVDEAAANAAQAAEWAAWVGTPAGKGKKAPQGAALLAQCPHLPLHTVHFDAEFKARVLACFDDLEAALGGELVHADNYAALRTLEPAYRERVKCIYIDPPYNTGSDGFLYKDSFQHASWASMLDGRLRMSRRLLSDAGVLFSSIDDKERVALDWLLRDAFGTENRVAELVWHNVTDNNPTRVAVEHEFIACFTKNSATAEPEWKSAVSQAKQQLIDIGKTLITAHGDTQGLQEAYKAWYRENRTFLGTMEGYKFIDQQGVYCGSRSVHNPGKEGYRYDVPYKGDASRPCKQPLMGYRFPWATMQKLLEEDRILFGEDETKLVELKVYAHEYEDKLSSVLTLDGRSGANELRALFGSNDFKNPKTPALLETLFPFVTKPADTILDFYAGSGTTAHAIVNLNREARGERKFLLVEQSAYFDTLTLPRIAKLMTAPEWKDGQPKPELQHDDQGDPEHWSRRTLPLVRVLRLERYEDSLNALDFSATAADGDTGNLLAASADEHLIRYWLQDDSAGQPVRLSTQRLADPFAYRLTLQEPSGPREATVDLLETARLLLGLVPRRLREARDAQGRRHQWLEAHRCEDVARGTPGRPSLLWLRPVDDERSEADAQAEYHWLAAQLPLCFKGQGLGDFATVWHNRAAFWPAGQNAQSIDSLLAQRMLERAH